MSFPNRLLTRPQWGYAGTALTTIVLGLGNFAIFSPIAAADALGIISSTASERVIIEKAMVVFGIRDVAAAVVLYWYYSEGRQREMGVLTLAWGLVSATDTYVAATGPRGFDAGIWSLVGATLLVTFVGAGLVQS